MIGEGYGCMKELASTMREVQVALITARLTGETQKGEIDANEGKLVIVFR